MVPVKLTATHLAYVSLVVIDLSFIVLTAAAQFRPHGTRGLGLFDLVGEANLSVWYSSLKLTIAAGIAFALHRAPAIQRTAEKYVWAWLGCVFLALSADETAQIHERLGEAFSRNVVRVEFVTGGDPVYDVYGWLPLYAPLALLFGIALFAAIRWIRDLPRVTRVLMIAGVLSWFGVLVAEVVESRFQREARSRVLQAPLEEGLELAGATMFLIATNEYLRRAKRLQFDRPQNEKRFTPYRAVG